MAASFIPRAASQKKYLLQLLAQLSDQFAFQSSAPRYFIMYIKNLGFLLSLYVSQAAANAVPIVPTITPAAVLPRQVDQNFIGWFSDPTTGCRSPQHPKAPRHRH